MANKELVKADEKTSLVRKFADRYSIDHDKLLGTLRATSFKQSGTNAQPVSNEQMCAMLVVADQYGLNPFTREIFAFPDKGGIVPVVSVDGWSRIINDHGQLDGIQFRYSDKLESIEGAKPCPEWCEVVIYRKDRSQPIVVREYLDEVFRKLSYANPWQTHTKRMLRHKALIQGARVAFGFAGIYDEDEAARVIDMGEANRADKIDPDHETVGAAGVMEKIKPAEQKDQFVADMEKTEQAN